MTTPSHPSFQQLLEFAFPKELLEAFVVTQFDAEKHVRDDVEIIRITFVEQNAPPPIKNLVSTKSIMFDICQTPRYTISYGSRKAHHHPRVCTELKKIQGSLP